MAAFWAYMRATQFKSSTDGSKLVKGLSFPDQLRDGPAYITAQGVALPSEAQPYGAIYKRSFLKLSQPCAL